MPKSHEMSEEEFEKLAEEKRKEILDYNADDSLQLIEQTYQLWLRWAADLHLIVIHPTIPKISPPKVIEPEPLTDAQDLELVYPIHDYGYKLSTAKADDMYTSGMSMYKLHNTIEKMIAILIERLDETGVDKETEVKVAFDGHELAQRKAFESIINLSYNVVVTNFDPGDWGERYLQTVKRLAEKGYGYPAEAPRYGYRYPIGMSPSSKS